MSAEAASGAGPAEPIAGLPPGVALHWLASAPSTNTLVLERLKAGDTGPLIVVADEQTAGRGRNGRRWESAPGRSLTFSYGAMLAPLDWSGLSLAVGVALADAIEPLADGAAPRLQLKWPNDLWLADRHAGAPGWRKLGGILIETVGGGVRKACVVGIGLNLLPVVSDATYPSGYAWVGEIVPGLDARLLLARVAAPLAAALQRFEREGLAPFQAAFARRDLLRGRAVEVGGRVAGLGQGVDTRGALRLLQGGRESRLASGEVQVRPGAGAATEGA